MKCSELIRIAKQHGWKFVEQKRTSHRAYEKNGTYIVIPFHGSKEVPTGTCKHLLKEIKKYE
jgi:predicted RNA binding protein YcfA (HicA-like mRNA interferase family)